MRYSKVKVFVLIITLVMGGAGTEQDVCLLRAVGVDDGDLARVVVPPEERGCECQQQASRRQERLARNPFRAPFHGVRRIHCKEWVSGVTLGNVRGRSAWPCSAGRNPGSLPSS